MQQKRWQLKIQQLLVVAILLSPLSLFSQNKDVVKDVKDVPTRLIDDPEPIEQVILNVNLSFVGTLYQQQTSSMSYSFPASGGVVTFAANIESGSLNTGSDIIYQLNNHLHLSGADTLMRFSACSTSLNQNWYNFTLEILANNSYSQSDYTKAVERTINLNFSASTGPLSTISISQAKGTGRPPLFPPWPDTGEPVSEPFADMTPDPAQDNETLTNWIKTITYIGDDPYTPSDSIVDIVYYNGLGLPKQSVQVGASANLKRNIVTPMMYDPLGRVARQLLPYVSTSSTVTYDGSTSTKQANWYKGIYGSSEINPYRETIFEAGLQRPLAEYNVGSVFRNAQSLEGTPPDAPQGRYLAYEYNISTAEERVPCLQVQGEMLIKRGYYSMGNIGSISKTVTTNEDGVKIATFTDNTGRTILKRRYINGTQQGQEENWSDLVYAYNEQQLLALVITPEGEMLRDTLQTAIPLSSQWVKDYCYTYSYDGRGRMIARRFPGCGEEKIVLSPAGLVCATQDSMLRERNLWVVTNYTIVKKPKERMLTTATFTEEQMRAMFDYSYQQAEQGYSPAIYNRTDNITLAKSNYGKSEAVYYISEQGFELSPQPAAQTITIDFFPENGLIGISDVSSEKYASLLTESVALTSYPDGSRLGAGNAATQGIPNALSTTPQYKHIGYFYDHRARLIQKQTLYPDGSKLIESTRYNYIGTPLREAARIIMPYKNGLQQGSKDTLTALLTTTFTYDKRGRMLTRRDTLKRWTNNTSPQTFTTWGVYSYDELGRLMTASSSNVLRTFAYNVQDWVTEFQAKRGNQIIYSQALNYYNPAKSGTTPLYSGNISEWQTSQYSNGTDFSAVGATANTTTYTFTYDKAGRLTASDLYQGTSNTPTTAFTERGITYDRNSNILTLSRMAQSTTTPLHNLTYGYSADKLTSINGTQNGTPISATYSYNGNGAVSYDGMQNLFFGYEIGGMTSIVREGSQTGEIKAAYSYFADGEKDAISNNSTQQRIYRGPFTIIKAPAAANAEVAILESADAMGGNVRLAYAATPYIQPSTGDTLSYVITYDELHIIKDHLGSVRAVINSTGNIRERNDYYPFGLRTDQGRAYPTFSDRYTVKVPRLTQGPGGTLSQTGYNSTQPYTLQYNGKEQQLFANTNLIDYGARQYNPTLARWTTQDPLAEKYYNISPYAYCAGNPIRFVDVEGKVIIVPDWEKVWTRTSGALQMVSGAAQAVGGAITTIGTAPTVVGAIAGTAIVSIGIDNAVTGAKQLWTGEEQQTMLYQGVKDVSQLLGVNANTANKIATGFDMSTMLVAPKVPNVTNLSKGIGKLSNAEEFGIDSYKALKKAVVNSKGKNSGLVVHHLIEQRFAKTLGLKQSEMLSIVLTPEEHKIFTKAWRSEIPYKNVKKGLNTESAQKCDITKALKDIYKDYPDILKALEK